MPNHLPAAVFCHRALVHVFSHLLTWCRGILVGFVWLICLPLAMRMVWRWLFWVGDAGWARDVHVHHVRTPQSTSEGSSSVTLASVVSSISSALETNSTAAAQALPSILSSISHPSNRSVGDFSLLKALLFRFNNIGPYSSVAMPMSGSASSNSTNTTSLSSLQHSSLLSDVAFFSSFTSSPFINRIILDIFEGQVITIVVVIAFILIFLIREWVVQQQPIIALGRPEQNIPERAGNEVEQVAAPLEDDDHDDLHIDDHDDPPALEEPDIRENHDDDRVENLPQDRSDTDAHSLIQQTSTNVDGMHANSEFDPGLAPEHLLQDSGLRVEASSSSQSTQANLSLYAASGDGTDERNAAHDEDRQVQLRQILEDMVDQLPAEMREQYYQTHRIDQVVQNMRGAPLEEVDRLMERISALSADLRTQMEEYQDITQDQADNDAEQIEDAAAPKASDSISSTDSEPEYEPRLEAGPLRGRPNMPSRERSFIATKIRRDIEEGDHRRIRSATRTAGDDQAEEPNSEDSSESWQNVSDIDGDIASQSVPTTAERRSPALFDGAPSRPTPRIHVGESTSEESGEDEDHSSSSSSAAPPSPAGSNGSVFSRSSSVTNAEQADTPPPEDDELPEAAAIAAANETAEPPPAQRQALPPGGPFQRLLDWLWGDVAPADIVEAFLLEAANEEHIVEDFAEEEPFVPFADGEPVNEADDMPDLQEQDPEVAAAAAEAGIDLDDADAVEDAEDLEGILELIGMQGPITGLFQNAIFSAVLIAATLVGAIGIPYVCGKLVLFIVGNPISALIKMPLQLMSSFADLVVDLTVALFTSIIWSTLRFASWFVEAATFSLFDDLSFMAPIEDACGSLLAPMTDSWERIWDNVSRLEAAGDFLWFSASSHAALRTIQDRSADFFALLTHAIGQIINYIIDEASIWVIPHHLYVAFMAMHKLEVRIWHHVCDAALAMWNAKTLKVSLDFAHVTYSDDISLQYWSAKDRIIATMAGYTLFAVAGIVYQKRLIPITSSEQGRKVEGIISEILQQTGGVFKVILIISIEMIAFPLYCGVLLDVAMLPLCVGATMRSRLDFALTSPWTAGFVHWFVGTCYMFHFALFVSMCRKIMRRGVLYFIRDPDDPTFHPVRDVLERNVTTQLRKITFSAMVYGALIIVCLGGVVWTLDLGFQSILPIRWHTNQPALEFPLDLLFYNFLTPLVAKALKPNETLQTMYTWWFQTCARFLRLSDFLFGSRPRDEEGHHVRRTWQAWLRREKGDVEHPVVLTDNKSSLRENEQDTVFVFDGRFVRAPATDQVRIPKGQRVFVDVDEENNRLDDVPEEDSGVHSKASTNTKMVYIPPHFRFRIAFFIFMLWFFAAATGVGVTVLPLVFGRSVLRYLTPEDWKMNDIYAFSIGAYVLGGIKYLVMDLRSANRPTQPPPRVDWSSLTNTLASIRAYTVRAMSFVYVYSFLVFVMPVLFTILLELYILLPLHTYLGPDEPHIVHIVQDWTLGFLYARIAYRTFFSDRTSRPSRALQAVVRDGYLKPNARLATRCFILPLTVLFSLAILAPFGPYLAIRHYILPRFLPPDQAADPEIHKLLARYAYPVVLGLFLTIFGTQKTGIAVSKWRRLIKDEVYLIGERLHNFNDTKPGPMTSALGKVVAEAAAEAEAQAQALENGTQHFEGAAEPNYRGGLGTDGDGGAMPAIR